MLIEPRIFHGDHGSNQVLGNLGDWGENAAFDIKLADQFAIVGIDTRDEAGMVDRHGFQRWEVPRDVPKPGSSSAAEQHNKQTETQQRESPPWPPPRVRRRLPQWSMRRHLLEPQRGSSGRKN
jgi:hypothetical protein